MMNKDRFHASLRAKSPKGTKRSNLKKALAVFLAGVFLLAPNLNEVNGSGFTSTVCWADNDKLAPPLGSKSETLKVRFLAGEVLLSHKRYNEYIAKRIEEIGYDKLLKTTLPLGDIVDGVEFIAIPGLLKFTGLPAHVGLGRYYGKPVIYIDDDLFYDEDIRRHEKDEVAGWESIRRLLGRQPDAMREWIMQNIDTPASDEGLKDTAYHDKTSREIGQMIHNNSHRIPKRFYKEYAEKINYEHLIKLLTLYGDEEGAEHKKDLTIAAGKRSKEEPRPASVIAENEAETEETKADKPEDRRRFERISRHIAAKFTLEYGSLAEDHPVTRYVRNVFEEMMGEEAKDYRVIVAPAWNQINAVALPDGTIIVSRRLLEFVEYKEELQGVLAHEVVHIQRRHIEMRGRLIERIKADINIEIILDTIGLIRLQETEADLRWVVKQLRHKGKNPFGYQIFLERFDEFRDRSGAAAAPDWKHGGLDERALNIESIFHYIDLESLSRDLTKIPADGEFKTALQEVRQANKLTLWSGLPTHLGKVEIEMACQEALLPAGQMPVPNIGIALKNFVAENADAVGKLKELDEGLLEKQKELNTLREAYRKSKAASRRREIKEQAAEIKSDIVEIRERIEKLKIVGNGYKELSEICVNRINDEVITGAEWKNEKERCLARALYYNLYSNIRYFGDPPSYSLPSALRRQHLEDRKTILSEEMMRSLPAIMADARFHKLPIICLMHDPSYLLADLIKTYMKIKGMETRPTKKKIDDCVDFAASFARSLEDLYKIKGNVKVNRDELLAKAAELIKAALQSKYVGLLKHIDERVSALGKSERIRPEVMEYGLYKEAEDIMNMIRGRVRFHKRFAISDYRDILMRIETITRGRRLNADGTVNFFRYISNAGYDYTMLNRDRLEKDKSLIGCAAAMRYTIFRLFEETVDTFDQFTILAPLTKEIILLKGLTAFACLNDLKIGKGEGEETILVDGGGIEFFLYALKVEGKTALASEDNEYLKIQLNSLEKIWLTPKRSRQDVRELYKGLVETEIEIEHGEAITCDIFIRILANYLARYTGWAAFFAEIETLEKMGVPVSKLITENKEAFGLALANIWTTLPQEPSREEARQILLATNFVVSPFLRSQLQAYYYDRLWPQLDFDAKLDALFSREAGGFFDLRRFNDFVEKEARTESELHQALERLNSEYDALMAEGSSQAGILTIFNYLGTNPETMHELILALLTTGDDDSALKNLVYKEVKYHHTDVYYKFALNDVIDSAEKIVSGFYSMDTSAKYILLRKALTGQKGLLSNAQYRERFLNALVSRIIDDKTEPGLREIINKTVSALGKNPAWKHLYFGLQPIILNKIAIPPKRPTPWSEVPSVVEDVEDMKRRGVTNALSAVRETLIGTLASEHKECPWRFEKGLVRYSEDILSKRLKKLGIITPLKRTERMSPLSFVIEAAQNTGSLGVRFLQLLPQFIPNLTADYQERFSRVYDSVRGQSKPSAMAVLEREWQGFWNDVESSDECVGGGSMATVYHIRTKAGRDEVVKVLNPNLKFFLETRAEFMRSILDEMSRRYGGEYEMARFVLDDVVEWIKKDADFKGFLEKDRVFRDDMGNNGFTVNGSKYSIYVPRSYAVPGKEETPYVIREEFINRQSRNLTEWDLLIREGNDMKDIISLITRNYIKQLQDGLVHSDVHVGNFRVTRDKKVAILDRNFYLELNSDMKELINDTLLNPAVLFTVSPEEFLDRALNISTEKDVTLAQRERLIQSINLFLNNIKETGSISEVGNLLVNLRQNGLKLPLEVTLIFKNLNALQQMALRAGFSGGLIEAYLYPDTKGETPSSLAEGKAAARRGPSPKGSPADCLDTIKTKLLSKALNKTEGVRVNDVARLRPYHPQTVYKEFKILKSLGVFVPVVGRRGYYAFSDMMIGPDENYTRTIINAISDIRYQVGKRGEARPLHRWIIPDEKIGLVRELAKMAILHQINVAQRPVIPDGKVLWHILEQDVVSVSQRSSFAQEVNNAAQRSKAPERIYILKKDESIEDAIARIGRDHPDAIFDIALSDESHIGNVPGDIKRLVFKGSAGDVAQLEGIVAALRALHGPKDDIIPTLKRIYAVLKGAACRYDIPPDALDDPVRFARSFIFDLPPVTPIPVDEIPKMNERLRKLLVAA